MIKNIVFDMGKVLVDYDAMNACRQFCRDEKEQREVWMGVFNSREWTLLDIGLIEEKEAVRQMCERLEGEHTREAARLCMEHWHEYCMWPIEGMGEIVREQKEKGYGIYLCSNASIRLLSCYRQVIPGIQYFDGVLFSAAEKLIKPQKEIYERLFDRFGLRPEECFFIDDLMDNVQGAENCGMKGYCFADGDQGALRERLKQL